MKQQLLIPVKKLKAIRGNFTWGKAPLLISPFADDQIPLAQLVASLRSEMSTRARISRNPQKDGAVIVRRSNAIKHSEGYKLTVAPKKIELTASTSAGAYYGIQTLRELVTCHGARIPCCEITDEPDMKRRGIYLDCSRGKVPTVDTVKLLIEYLARCKLNELQLYIENVFTFKSHPDIGRGFSPYTPADIIAIQDHCKLHHINCVPSLTSFGHFERILGLPAYQHLGELAGHNNYPGGTTLCPTDPGSIRLIEDMYDDFLPLFEASDFNVCGDEPWELGKGRSKTRADKIGVGAVYLPFVKKLHKLCAKHGKRMNLWSDIVLNHPEIIPDIPKDVVMLNWDYNAGGSRMLRTRELVKAGLNVVICPGTQAWGSHGTRLEEAILNVSRFAKVGRQNGVDGMLNTNWGDSGHRNPLGVSFHGFAHGAAHSWNGRGVNDKTFTETFCFHVLKTADPAAPALIRNIGSVEERVKSNIYYIFAEAFDPNRKYASRISPISPLRHGAGKLDEASEEGCREVIATLKGSAAAARKVTSKDTVARLVIADVLLASQLDSLTCRKILAARLYRAGKRIPARTLDKLAVDTGALAKIFAENWLKLNRPSRLKDNLTLFRDAIREYADIAKL